MSPKYQLASNDIKSFQALFWQQTSPEWEHVGLGSTSTHGPKATAAQPDPVAFPSRNNLLPSNNSKLLVVCICLFFFLCTTKSFSTKLFCSATSDLQQMGKKMHFALFAAISLLCGVTFTTRTWTPQHLLMQNQSGKYFKTRVVIFTVVVSQELLLWIKSFTYLHP